MATNRPDNFHGLDLTSPLNRIPGGKVAMAQNVRAYIEGGFMLRNGLGDPLITVDSSVNSLCRMNDTTPDGPEDGFCIIIGTDSGAIFVYPSPGDSGPVVTGLSGDQVAIVPFRPNTSVQPWSYIGDDAPYPNVTVDSGFQCTGMVKVRSDGLSRKAGIKEPQTAPVVSTGATAVPFSGNLEANAVPWTNFSGANPDYNYSQTTQPGTGGVGEPFIIDLPDGAQSVTISITGTATINGATHAPGDAGPTGATYPAQFSTAALIVIGAFTDGSGNVLPPPAGSVPFIIGVGAGGTFPVPNGAAQLQLGIDSDNAEFAANSGSFAVTGNVNVSSFATVPSTVGNVTAYVWGDSPHSGPVASYIWKNPADVGSGIARSIGTAPVTTTNNSWQINTTPAGNNPTTAPQWDQLATDGSVTGDIPLFSTPFSQSAPNYTNFNACLAGTIFFPTGGTHTLEITYKDQILLGIGGGVTAAYSSGVSPAPSSPVGGAGQTISVASGLPLVFVSNPNGEGGAQTTTLSLSVPASGGLFQWEIDWDFWFHAGCSLVMKIDGAVIPPLPAGTRTNVSYAYTFEADETGAESNPSPASTPSLTPVLNNVVTPEFSPDPQVTKVNFYRQDEGLPNFTFVGQGPNTDPPTPIIDSLSDLAVANNPELEYDNFEPVPSIDLPHSGTCNVSGGVITALTGEFDTRWLAGTVILIGAPPPFGQPLVPQVAYSLIARPTSTTEMTIPGVPDGENLLWNIAEPKLAAQPLAYIWGPTDNINYGFGVGDPDRPGTLYWSKGSNLDAWPDTNQMDVTDPSEPLVNGAMSDGLGVLFSIKRAWIIYPNFFNALATVTGTSGSTWTLQATAINRGLFIPRCLAVEGAGNIFFRVDDGIHLSRAGAGSVSITDDDLWPLFPHESSGSGASVPEPVIRNGVTIFPPDDSQPEKQRFSIQNGYLYYDYAFSGDGIPVTNVAPFTPASVVDSGMGIAWQDPADATASGAGSNQTAQITGFSISGNVVTFSMTAMSDPLVEGQDVTIAGLTTGNYMNGAQLEVLPGATSTSFSANFTHADVAQILDIGTATPSTAFAFAVNSSLYSPPAGQNTLFAFPAGTQEGAQTNTGGCIGGNPNWGFVAGNGYGSGANGCPLGMTPAAWESTAVGIPTLPPGAVIESIVPVAFGTAFGFGGQTFSVNNPDYTDGAFDFCQSGGWVANEAPSLGTDLSALSSTTFEVQVSETLEGSDPAYTFGLDVAFYGVAINYTVPGAPISPTLLQTLVATNCGLSIPDDEAVSGILVKFNAGMASGSGGSLLVQLTLNGAPVGEIKSVLLGQWSTPVMLGGNGDTWNIEGLTGSEVNGANGLGVNIWGTIPFDSQIDLNGLSGDVYYTSFTSGEGRATLVYDIRARGFVWDAYQASQPTVHAPNEGQSQQGTLVGCSDGSVRLMESGSGEPIDGLVVTPAIGGVGWMTAYQATFEYSCDSGATVSFVAADEGNGSYGPEPIVLPATGGQITKFTTKVTPNKWKLLQEAFSFDDPTLQVYQDGCVLDVKPWGSDGVYEPVQMFRPSGGKGAQP